MSKRKDLELRGAPRVGKVGVEGGQTVVAEGSEQRGQGLMAGCVVWRDTPTVLLTQISGLCFLTSWLT